MQLPTFSSTGRVSPDKFGGYKSYALAKYTDRIKRWIAKRPNLTLLKIQGSRPGFPRRGCRLPLQPLTNGLLA